MALVWFRKVRSVAVGDSENYVVRDVFLGEKECGEVCFMINIVCDYSLYCDRWLVF